MTRKQRDSELRLTFAKKLKSKPQENSQGKKESKAPVKTPVRYSDLTSDSETPTSGKKPLLGNKRKSNLDHSKNQKRQRQDVDTTTTDDNEDTEESDHKLKPNTNFKRKSNLPSQNSKVGKHVNKAKDDFSDEETEESDYKSNTVQKKTNSNLKTTKLMKKVIEISDDEEPARVKKKPLNAKVAQLVKKRKDDFSDESDDSSESDSDARLEEDLKKAIATKFPSYKSSNSNKSLNNSSLNKSRPQASSMKKPTPRPPMTAVKRPTPVEETPQDKQNARITNVPSVSVFTNSTNRKKPDSLQSGCPKTGDAKSQRPANNIPRSNKSPSSSPQVKTDFDKLVDDLFEEDATRKRKEPEFMIINNEPTDVYTLSIDDTLDEEDDLENLEALCEEVEEDVYEEVPKPVTNLRTFSSSLGPKPKIYDINKPLRAPSQSFSSLKKEIYKPEIKPDVNKAPQTLNKTKTLVIPKTPGTSSNFNNFSTTTNNSKPSTPSNTSSNTPSNSIKPSPVQPTRPYTESNVDYKEKYNKLHISYEALSKKIAQYMDKTNKEKETLKRQLRLEKSKCTKAQEDLDIMKRKFQYLMKNRPSVKKKT